MKIILCGYHWIGCTILNKLYEDGHEIYVFTHKSPYYIPSVERECIRLEVDYSLDDISKSELPFQPDIIISIYYRYLIKEHIIDLCKGKIFNLHPSLLPKLRGCSSITWALINGDKQAGFTYHYIDKGCDTGNIILQKPFKIYPWDTQQSLYQTAMAEAAKSFDDAFNLVVNNFKGKQQTGEITYNQRGCPHNGEINPSWSIEYVERFIRAMFSPPLKSATLNGIEILSIEDYKEAIKDKK